MLPYNRITCFENRSRRKRLGEFAEYYYLYHTDTEALFMRNQDPDGETENTLEARGKLNKITPSVANIVKATGHSARTINKALQFDAPFWRNRVLDLLDRADGVYKDDLPKSIFRTLNPLYWFARLFRATASQLSDILHGIGLAAELAENLSKLLLAILAIIAAIAALCAKFYAN